MSSSLAQILTALRKEQRLALALPVKIYTLETAAIPEWSCTYEVSRHGLRLKQVPGVEMGQEIWIQRHNRKAKYRVVWLGQPETDRAGQMGAQCLDEKVIWEDAVQGRLC